MGIQKDKRLNTGLFALILCIKPYFYAQLTLKIVKLSGLCNKSITFAKSKVVD